MYAPCLFVYHVKLLAEHVSKISSQQAFVPIRCIRECGNSLRYSGSMRTGGGSSVSVKERVSRIFSALGEAPHGFKPSLTIFQELNLDIAKRDLRIEERAVAQAEDNEPALGSTTFDSVENDVVDLIESLKGRNRQTLSDQLEVYADRLAALNFEGRLGDLDIAIHEAKAEFKRIFELGLDELHARRRSLLRRESDLNVFREENKLRRSAQYPSFQKKVFLIGLIVVLGLVETIGNTTFLAKGNELGLLGAYTEAVVISGLNLVGAVIFALLCRNIGHIRIKRKIIGYLSAIGYFVAVIALNLLVAHYRDASGVFLENGGIEALARFQADPIGLVDIKSWILFGMGCLFSVITFWDTFHLEDLYPGYGKLTRVLDDDREEYLAEKEHHIYELGHHLSDVVETLRDTKHELVRWRQDHSLVLEYRRRVIEGFDEQLTHLERAGNLLLTVYRENNRKARGGKGPKRFKEPWKMASPHVDREIPATALDTVTMDRMVSEADGKLDVGISQLNDEHNTGLQKFRSLDELVDDDQLDEAVNV
jgi:hypothetical protein